MTAIRCRFAERVTGFLRDWSLPRQAAGQSAFAEAAESSLSRDLHPRLAEADKAGTIICPYCAVGCSQLAYANTPSACCAPGTGSTPRPKTKWGYPWLPRIVGDHSQLPMTLAIADGVIRGLFVLGQNPVIGGSNSTLIQRGFSNLVWLVVRDFTETETASFW